MNLYDIYILTKIVHRYIIKYTVNRHTSSFLHMPPAAIQIYTPRHKLHVLNGYTTIGVSLHVHSFCTYSSSVLQHLISYITRPW